MNGITLLRFPIILLGICHPLPLTKTKIETKITETRDAPGKM